MDSNKHESTRKSSRKDFADMLRDRQLYVASLLAEFKSLLGVFENESSRLNSEFGIKFSVLNQSSFAMQDIDLISSQMWACVQFGVQLDMALMPELCAPSSIFYIDHSRSFILCLVETDGEQFICVDSKHGIVVRAKHELLELRTGVLLSFNERHNAHSRFVNKLRFQKSRERLSSQYAEKNDLPFNDLTQVVDTFLIELIKHPSFRESRLSTPYASATLAQIEPPILLERRRKRRSQYYILLSACDFEVLIYDVASGNFKRYTHAESLPLLEGFVIQFNSISVSQSDSQVALLLHRAYDYSASSPFLTCPTSLCDQSLEAFANEFSAHKIATIAQFIDRESLFDIQSQVSETITNRGYGYMPVGSQRAFHATSVEGAINDPAVYANAKAMPVLSRLLGPDLVINSVAIVNARVGGNFQKLHRDHEALFDNTNRVSGPPRHEQSFAIVLAIPLVSLTFQTGTTRFVDASSDSGLLQPVVTDLGDAFIYDYALEHQGTPTLTENDRAILYVVYSKPWFREVTTYRKLAQLFISDAEFEKVAPQHRGLFFNRENPTQIQEH